MFFSLAKTLSIFAVATAVFASPVAEKRDVSQFSGNNFSFNNWGGLSSLGGFDDFFGRGDFSGSRNQQILIIENQQSCRREEAFIIQQQLAILEQVARQIITQQICDVETQVIILEQHRSRFRDFGRDLRRQTGRHVGFDANIAILLSQLLNSDGSLNRRDFGFRGSDIGKHFRITNGNNWDWNRSPSNIDQILRTIAGGSRSSNGTTRS